jgi:hypothetical protein
VCEVSGQRLQILIADIGLAKERHNRNTTTYELFHESRRQIPTLLKCRRRLPLVLHLQRNSPRFIGALTVTGLAPVAEHLLARVKPLGYSAVAVSTVLGSRNKSL